MPDKSAVQVRQPAKGSLSEGRVHVEVVARGDVTPDLVDLAATKISAITHVTAEPLLLARVKLTQEPDPARERPAIAQVTLDVNGHLVRAQVAARTMRDAIDLLEGRLRDKLDHRAERRQAGRRRDAPVTPGTWRHDARPAQRPTYFDRPVDERELVCRKSFATADLTVDEAAFDLEQLDHDFYLFRDVASGADCVLEKRGDGPYRLAHTGTAAVDPGPTAVPVEVLETPVPELAVDEAIERLDLSNEPFTFFVDTESGRGTVVYRRYDGHYGLIAPS
ncbi:MAG TPA: HPF/RaiA family ribosome-associated protein [Acidimicrobiales bacterium]|jgi:ribosome-associated translation inhibitor RaiA|nr:HPF/RaiA family ribosome-associated protein [Acidimicrobiales bacterium]